MTIKEQMLPRTELATLVKVCGAIFLISLGSKKLSFVEIPDCDAFVGVFVGYYEGWENGKITLEFKNLA